MQGQTLLARNPTPVPHSAQLFREVAALDDNTRSGLNWQMRTIYLHGFASSPSSKKAAFFRQRLPEMDLPDLAEGDFEHLTITGQLQFIERLAGGQPIVLIGSSLGGYLAALYASRHAEVEKLVLLAPAFGFARRWAEMEDTTAWRLSGYKEVYHYGQSRMCSLSYQLMEDALRYEDFPPFTQPALVFHGTRDDVVPAKFSQEFAATHVSAQLHLLNSDHELLDALDEIWRKTEPFLLG